MYTIVKRKRARRILVALIAVGALSSSAAWGETGPRGEADRWVPSIDVFGGLGVQNATGYTETSGVLQPYDTGTTGSGPNVQPIVAQPLERAGPTSGQERMMTPFVGGGLELMTPRITTRLWSPRFFAHVNVAGGFGPDYDIVKLGAPGEFESPAPELLPNPAEANILGQGSLVNVDPDGLLVFAGGGVSFAFKAWDRLLRVKPSVEYMREELTISGVTNRVITLDNTQPAASGNKFREVRLAGSETRTFHGVGPGLELEMDARRAGPFIVSVFLDTNFYAMLGDLTVQLTEQQTTSEGNVEHATWRFTKNSWTINGSVGLRFRWAPE